ncbi:WUSCHEL-related homeobox 8-like [Mercurialis annua]|uniref:WUSCHEL-related homeobox 8-like n=1 Tax=Mercurialis annua TaxID=3986 RepID=UPI00215F2E9B|nr:WUSCHEL-related homeobox 8-like [Mercurialis annua]
MEDEMLSGNELGVKLMTDDQMEMLRKQISVYTTLCQSLVQMHNSISARQDFSGMRVASSYNAPFWSYTLNKIPSRQRWAPKQEQLQKLESFYNESNVTPDRQKIKSIAAQLSMHGPISETNVYNWFQNRRARSKRKKSALPPPDNTESEPEVSKDERTKPDDVQLDENLQLMVNQMYFQSPEIGGIDQLMGNSQVPVSYTPFWQAEHELLG